MKKNNTDALCRILDANFNRTKEGLRVCEDVCRFVLDDRKLTSSYKQARHKIKNISGLLGVSDLIACRDIINDIGKGTSDTEKKRKNFHDIFFANSQRVKESLRVLEEVAKIKDENTSSFFKKLRYKVYELEKKAAAKI